MNDTGKMIWKIDSIISYVVESEMEGEIDKEDSWYPLIELLEDLKEKIKDEEDTITDIVERRTWIVIDKETGTEFDDSVEQTKEDMELGEYHTDTWTQVCDKHAIKYQLKATGNICNNEGHGICGVIGCDKESDHYYDFNRKEGIKL